jgi:hypothetical protein
MYAYTHTDSLPELAPAEHEVVLCDENGEPIAVDADVVA